MVKDKVTEYLDKLNIDYRLIHHKTVSSIDECKSIEGLVGGVLCKNLFLTTTNKKVKYLLILDADKRFVTKDISKKLNVSRLSFASDDEMINLLNTTPGSLSIMSLIFDSSNDINLAIDKDVLCKEYFYCHPCENDATLVLKTCDIIDKLIPSLNKKLNILNI